MCWSLSYSDRNVCSQIYKLVQRRYEITVWILLAVVQLVEALRYKPEGRGFDSQ